MKKLLMIAVIVVIPTVLAGCGGSYAYRRYESYGGGETSYWYIRWEQKSDHRRTDIRPPIRYGTDIYHYSGRTEIMTAPSLQEEGKKTVAVKKAERRIRSVASNQ